MRMTKSWLAAGLVWAAVGCKDDPGVNLAGNPGWCKDVTCEPLEVTQLWSTERPALGQHLCFELNSGANLPRRQFYRVPMPQTPTVTLPVPKGANGLPEFANILVQAVSDDRNSSNSSDDEICGAPACVAAEWLIDGAGVQWTVAAPLLEKTAEVKVTVTPEQLGKVTWKPGEKELVCSYAADKDRSRCMAKVAACTPLSLRAEAQGQASFKDWRMGMDEICKSTGSDLKLVAGQRPGSSVAGVALSEFCDANMATANFLAAMPQQPHPKAVLAVAVSGEGQVTSTPSGINCRRVAAPGEACSASFDPGTQVTLRAATSDRNIFEGWSGACSGSGATCRLDMDSAKQVSASFRATACVPDTETGDCDLCPNPLDPSIRRRQWRCDARGNQGACMEVSSRKVCWSGTDRMFTHDCGVDWMNVGEWVADPAIECTLQRGPGRTLPPGRYRVTFGVDNYPFANTTSHLLLDVWDEDAGRTVVELRVYGTLGIPPVKNFSLDFTNPPGCHRLSFRVRSVGLSSRAVVYGTCVEPLP